MFAGYASDALPRSAPARRGAVARGLLVRVLMSTTTATLPRPTFSAVLPRERGSYEPAAKTKPALIERGAAFMKAHWKQIGMAALGLLGWRSKLLRPLVRKAALLYVMPAARRAFARAL